MPNRTRLCCLAAADRWTNWLHSGSHKGQEHSQAERNTEPGVPSWYDLLSGRIAVSCPSGGGHVAYKLAKLLHFCVKLPPSLALRLGVYAVEGFSLRALGRGAL